jgi:hypothetical protein
VSSHFDVRDVARHLASHPLDSSPKQEDIVTSQVIDETHLEKSASDSAASHSNPRPGSGEGDANPERDDGQLGFFERLLRDGESLDAWLMDPARLPGTIRQFLAVVIAGFSAHGLLIGFVSTTIVRPRLGMETTVWYAQGIPLVSLPVALVGAFLTATAVGLPSFYFYSRLAGVDVSFRLVAAQSLRALAKTSVALLGAMPLYAAVVLSTHLGYELDASVINWGLAIPFIAGLLGIESVYASFNRMVVEHDRETEGLRIVDDNRRTGLLGMVLAWGALFSTVAPVALWRYGEFLASVFA